MEIRPATPADLERIAEIQRTSPEAAQWDPRCYFSYDCRVAVEGGRVAGFLVVRETGEGEYEILNVAVDPGLRRSGVGASLIRSVIETGGVAYFLEVRESNLAALELYRKLGFREMGIRPAYYTEPVEAAIVMGLQSC